MFPSHVINHYMSFTNFQVWYTSECRPWLGFSLHFSIKLIEHLKKFEKSLGVNKIKSIFLDTF